MNDFPNRALLPAGLRDMLPPDAAYEAEVVHRVMSAFAAHGYDRVKPPLIEYEESLLANAGAGAAAQAFRMMDPMAQRMMAVRPDMTMQIARIVTTRMTAVARPLRLSYAGQVLRVKGSQLRPERQFGQAGLELIGSDSPAADVEVAVLATRALAEVGVTEASVDLGVPPLVPAACAELGCDLAMPGLRDALDHKDVAAVSALGGAAAEVLRGLIGSCGAAEPALARLKALPLPKAAAAERDRLAVVVERIRAAAPDLKLTIDPVENRGFEYYTGISFAIFSRHSAAELGRGGRYLAGGSEPAVGATLFMDSVLAAVPGPQPQRRLFVPAGADPGPAAALRAGGWVTVAGLEPVADSGAEAARLGCTHVLDGAAAVPVPQGGK